MQDMDHHGICLGYYARVSEIKRCQSQLNRSDPGSCTYVRELRTKFKETEMKILYINSVYGYGSTGKIIRKLKEEAEKQGNEAFVIFGRTSAIGYKGSLSEEENTFYIHSSIEQKVDLLSSVLFDSHGLHSREATKKIIAKIKELNPDLIHLHNLHGFYLNYPKLFQFFRNYGRPIVWTMHDCWAFTGYCSHFMYNECEEWKSGCKHCRYRNVYPYRLLSRSASNYIKKMQAFQNQDLTIVTPSKWLKEEVGHSFLKNYDCHVIYNDVNLDSFFYDPGTVREDHAIGTRRMYLACANVWTAQKGFDDCRKLAEKMNENEVLVMIGLSRKQIGRLPENIIGVEHCDAEELHHWYSACDAFFNPTLEDTFPTVNLEAAACGAPIITYRTGGSPEAAGNHGIVVERYDVDQALTELRSADRAKMPAAETRTRTMAEEYLDLYYSVTESGT